MLWALKTLPLAAQQPLWLQIPPILLPIRATKSKLCLKANLLSVPDKKSTAKFPTKVIKMWKKTRMTATFLLPRKRKVILTNFTSSKKFLKSSWKFVYTQHRTPFILTNYFHLSHYSKSQIFVQKFNFDKTPTFSRVLHPNFFDNFYREIKVVNS